MSALPPKADIRPCDQDVRFGANGGLMQCSIMWSTRSPVGTTKQREWDCDDEGGAKRRNVIALEIFIRAKRAPRAVGCIPIAPERAQLLEKSKLRLGNNKADAPTQDDSQFL